MLLHRVAAAALALLAAGAAHADQLADIKAKKEIVIATEAQFTPFEFLQDGKIVGYGPDLMNYILQADLPDVKVRQLELPFQGVLPGLAAKRFDFVVTSVTMTKDRAAKFAFTVPIADATTALVKRKDNEALADPSGIAGKTVGSQAGSAQLKALQEYAAKLKEQGKPEVTIREYVSFDEAYADLGAGRLDAVAQSLANLSTLVKTRGDVYAVIDTPIGPKTYFGWVGRKGEESASLVKLFSDGIARAQKTGTLQALQMKWFGFTMDVPTDSVPEPEL